MDTLGPLPKFFLTLSCISPVFLTYGYIACIHKDYYICISFCAAAIFTAISCLLTLRFVAYKTYAENINVTSFKPADKEISGYFVSYLMPLVSTTDAFYSEAIGIFFIVAFFIFIFFSKSFYSNPILSLFRYKFYEVTIASGGCLLLITRKNMVNINDVKKVAYATTYTVVEAKKKATQTR